MKDTTRENTPDSAGDEQDDPRASYTPQQRRTIIKGLRIWARVAIRSYMREQSEQTQEEQDGGGEEEE